MYVDQMWLAVHKIKNLAIIKLQLSLGMLIKLFLVFALIALSY